MKKLLIASALALSSVVANAAVISAGGISWDDDPLTLLFGADPGGVSNEVKFQQWFIDPTDLLTPSIDIVGGLETIIADKPKAGGGGIGAELIGIGEFDVFSDGRGPGGPGSFCTVGPCELTFAFGGLTVVGFNGTTPLFGTAGSWFNIYYDDGSTTGAGLPNFDTISATDTTTAAGTHAFFAEAQDGTPWAALGFDSFDLTGTILGGASEAFLSIRPGLADATVEAAWDYNNPIWGGSDMAFTATAIFPGGDYTLNANGQAEGFSVPEPTTLSILGLGLLGMSVFARRRKAK